MHGDHVGLEGRDWRWWRSWYLDIIEAGPPPKTARQALDHVGARSQWFFCGKGCFYTTMLMEPNDLLNRFTQHCLLTRCPEKGPDGFADHKFHEPFSPYVVPDVTGTVEAAFKLGGRDASTEIAMSMWSKAQAKAWRQALHALKREFSWFALRASRR